MEQVTGAVAATLNSYTITGHALIDNLILASLVPLILAYISTMFGFIRDQLSYLFRTIERSITEKIKTKFCGQVKCEVTISDSSTLFPLIKNIVFDKSVSSDLEPNLVQKISNIITEKEKSNDTTTSGYYYKYQSSYYDSYEMMQDYSGEKAFLITKKYSTEQVDVKYFKYNEASIRICLKEAVSGEGKKNELVISLISFDTKSKKKYTTSDIESFFRYKFNITEKLNYTYTVKITDPTMYNSLSTFYSTNLKRNSAALCDDLSTIKYLNINNDKTVSDTYQLLAKYKNGSFDDSGDNFVLQAEGYGSTTTCYYAFDSLYKKFKNTGRPSSGAIIFFSRNNVLALVSLAINGSMNNSEIVFVSFGKLLTPEDIEEQIKFMVNYKKNNIKEEVVEKSKVSAYKWNGNWHNYVLDKREFSTIFIEKHLMDSIKKEMEGFFRMETLYKDCDLPYKKGLLFYGPPGTGKTSLVKAIAYEYQLPVYTFNINDGSINDDTIIDMLNSISGNNNKIILFEDIDSAFVEKEKVKFEGKMTNTDGKEAAAPVKYLTYAGLLNALDGVLASRHGTITIMTTNYIDKLGDALIRPGRIDHKYLLGPCDYNQIVQMTTYIIKKNLSLLTKNNFHKLDLDKYNDEYLEDKVSCFAKKIVDEKNHSIVKPCALQQYILKYIEYIDPIFENYQELLE